MFRNRHSYNSSNRKWSIRMLVAMLSLLLLGAAVGVGTMGTQAQAARLPLDSLVATTTGVNLREQPAANGATLAILPVNAQAIVIGGPFNDSWYWLNYGGVKGYAVGNYLVIVDDKYTPVPATPVSAGTPSTVTPPSPQSTTVAGTPQSTPTPSGTRTEEIVTPTQPGDYTGLWLGEMSQGGNVRSGPSRSARVLKGWWAGRRVLLYQTVIDGSDTWYRVSEPPEAPMYVHASLIRKVAPVKFEAARYRGRWVNINISQQIVTAYEDGTPVKVTLTSTGKAKTPTELGVWKIYYRLPKQTMEGGNLASGDYYRLENVPYPQYFHSSGEGLHGTFWHDNFGRPMSHGCVNLSTPMSEWFYGWSRIGTIVYVHN